MNQNEPVYREPKVRTRNEIEQALKGDDPSQVNPALFDAAFNDPSWEWVQEKCVLLASHPVWNIRAASATALGDVARIHGKLDLDIVIPVLVRLSQDEHERVVRSTENAIAVVRRFIPASRSRLPGSP
jgi:hypothetical protein